MALDVKVKIELSKAAGGVGSGIPLIVCEETRDSDTYVECYNIENVVAAGFDDESSVYRAAQMLFSQENRPEKIAVAASSDEITAITKFINKDWRQLVVVSSFGDLDLDISEYIETTNDKMVFFCCRSDAWDEGQNYYKGKKFDRTVIIVNNTPYANAALVGATAGRPAGSFTYKFKTLKGVVAEELTEAEIEAIHNAGAIGYVTKAGDDVTTEGISQSGKYIDITDSIDYVIKNIEHRIQKTLNNTAKVTYDNRGIALLEAAVTSALQDAGNKGIIAVKDDGTYDYSVSFAPRSATTEADREARVYPYGTFKFALAGAIHSCDVYGEITY